MLKGIQMKKNIYKVAYTSPGAEVMTTTAIAEDPAAVLAQLKAEYGEDIQVVTCDLIGAQG